MHPSFFLPASQLSAFPQNDEKCNSSKKNNSWKSVTRTRIFLYSPWVNIILWIEWKMSKIYCHYFFFFFFLFLIWQETQKDQEWKEMRPTLYLLRREEKPSVGLALLQEGELPPPPFPNQEGKETLLQASTGFPEHRIKNELSNIFSYPNTQAFRCGESVQKFKHSPEIQDISCCVILDVTLAKRILYFGRNTSFLFFSRSNHVTSS